MTADTDALQRLLDHAAVARPEVYDELLLRACDRLRLLARRRLRGFPALRRWVETDDVVQQAMLRLHRCLAEVKPATVSDFLGLAGVQIRRELHDLHRHHFGPQGHAANHDTDGRGLAADDGGGPLGNAAADPEVPVGWDTFDTLVGRLPEEEKAVVDCIFVNDLTQEETATVLGCSLRTVKRRWQSARLRLQAAIERGEAGDDGR